MYKIIITEKPSVAREYESVLQIDKKSGTEGYIEGKSRRDGNDYRITWSVGHLVTLSYPGTYDEKYVKWNLDDLPFLPAQYKYETIASVRKQYGVVKKLYHAKDIDTIYYAGDSGREGIYIQMLIRMLAGHTEGVTEKVVWIDSQTEDEILRGLREAKPLNAYQNLINAAYMRGIEDYAVGINFSRALSCKYGRIFNYEIKSKKYTPISVGRVMTCVLGMIVRREREIQSFKETVFYRPSAVSEDFNAKWKAIEGTKHFGLPSIYNNEGFLDRKEAEMFVQELSHQPALKITKAETKTERKQAPYLYNLAEIQNDCSKIFKISPDETLNIIQELYEQKIVTYPRTDARVLSSAVAKEIVKNIKGLERLGYPVQYIIENGRYQGLEKTRYCDDSKVTDHYAIIPTGQGNPQILTGLKQGVFDLILKRFLSIFYPPAEYKKVSLELMHSDNEYFYVSEKVLKEKGYLEVAGTDEPVREDTKLMQYKEGDIITAQFQINEGKTSPPKRYTSGSMIMAMENAGQLIEDEELRATIKGSGIGTSATRAAIIKKLIDNGYIMLEKKTQMLKPLVPGEKIFDIVSETIPALLSPKMTANWEKGLSQIEDGQITKNVYQEKLNQYIAGEIQKIKSIEVKDPVKDFTPEVIGECPYCGENLITTPNGYKCEKYGKEEDKCHFYISQVAGKMLSREDVHMLVTTGETDIIKGFKSKAGKKFDAKLVLNKEEKKISFEFPNANDPSNASDTDIVCPKCGCQMKKDNYYVSCECGLKISYVIAKKKLEDNQIKDLLGGQTELINGFISKKGKKFSAILQFDGEKVSFNFPEK